MKRIYTIGHSTRSIEDLIFMLKENQIQIVADVRLYPGSRKYPQYNKDYFQEYLSKNNISYMHFPDLGGRRKPRPDSKNMFWENSAFRGYADYMETETFRETVAQLAEIAEKSSISLMCAEAVWWRCHRRLIADWFMARGWEVIHIMDKAKTSQHKLSEAARFSQGNLFYS